ncbi:MAG: hypothetical protein IKS05_02455 [Oscillospiraceae bacterium]|nr:hypothetical protein [Oscillospiraceae bacterium]
MPPWAKPLLFENLIPGLPIMAGEVSDRRCNKAAAMKLLCPPLGQGAEKANGNGIRSNPDMRNKEDEKSLCRGEGRVIFVGQTVTDRGTK